MKHEQPADISKARKLLQKYKQELNHKMRVRYFTDALDLLDPYINDEPDSEAGRLSKNIRHAYIKELLESLPSLSTLDIDEWWQYFWELFIKQSDEVEALCNEDAILKQNYMNFLHLWGQEVMNFLQKKLGRNGLK